MSGGLEAHGALAVLSIALTECIYINYVSGCSHRGSHTATHMLFLILALATFVALVQGQAAAGGGGAGTPIIVVKPKPGETIVPVNLSTSSAYVYWGGDWTPATSACSQDAMNLSSDGNGTVSFGGECVGH